MTEVAFSESGANALDDLPTEAQVAVVDLADEMQDKPSEILSTDTGYRHHYTTFRSMGELYILVAHWNRIEDYIQIRNIGLAHQSQLGPNP